MTTNKQRDARKQRFWPRIMRQWQRSGLSVRAFCRVHVLSEPSMYAWRRTLAQRDSRCRFVPVAVVPDQPTAAVDGGDQDRLELMLPGGRRLRIGSDTFLRQVEKLAGRVVHCLKAGPKRKSAN